MNFNLLLFFLFICSCGVKGDPKAPRGSYVPSVLENYPDIPLDQPLNDGGGIGKRRRRK